MIHFRIEFEVEFEFGAILIVCRCQSKLNEQVFYGLLRLPKLHFNVCKGGVPYALPMITFYIVLVYLVHILRGRAQVVVVKIRVF